MKTNLLASTLLGAVALLGSSALAHANLIITAPAGTPTNATDHWQTEPAQGIPTGTGGTVDGTLVAVDAGLYRFQYGPLGLVANTSGHGNAANLNEFWVGANEAAAIAAGDVFCTQPGMAACGNVATVPGTSFTVNLPAGNVPFGWHYDQSGGNHTLLNGNVDDVNGAYLVQIGLATTAFAGPGPVAYLGLADVQYPADHDFQDLTLSVTEVPEPTGMVLLGAGLLGMAVARRRRAR